jgi:uncharacterized protein YecE (DUF72 family)
MRPPEGPGSAAERPRAFIGTAGWSIPGGQADRFPPQGSHLERYARVFNAAEINTAFYRPHRKATYERWAASVPDGFRFAVKVPKIVTHERRLENADDALDRFLGEVAGLGAKLGALLAQLPPSLAFSDAAARFLAGLRDRFTGRLVCEPRHPTWFSETVDALLREHRIGRAAADPAPVPVAAETGGDPHTRYHRLHGSPRMYYSAYTPDALDATARRLAADLAEGVSPWCIFDNTAAFAATPDALAVRERLGAGACFGRADPVRRRERADNEGER